MLKKGSRSQSLPRWDWSPPRGARACHGRSRNDDLAVLEAVHCKASVPLCQPLQQGLDRGDCGLNVHVAWSTGKVCPHVMKHNRWHRRPRRLEAHTVREARSIPDLHSLAALEGGGGCGIQRLHRALLSGAERIMYERHDARPFFPIARVASLHLPSSRARRPPPPWLSWVRRSLVPPRSAVAAVDGAPTELPCAAALSCHALLWVRGSPWAWHLSCCCTRAFRAHPVKRDGHRSHPTQGVCQLAD